MKRFFLVTGTLLIVGEIVATAMLLGKIPSVRNQGLALDGVTFDSVNGTIDVHQENGDNTVYHATNIKFYQKFNDADLRSDAK